MENHLEVFSNYLMFTFIRLEEDSEKLVNFVTQQIDASQNELSRSKLKIALGQLGELNKKLILEGQNFHHLFYLLHDIILKNQGKLLEVEKHIQKINDPSLSKKFETLVSVFENQILPMEKDISKIMQLIKNIENLHSIDTKLEGNRLISYLNQHNKDTQELCDKLSKEIEQFDSEIAKTAQYDLSVQELYNQFMVK
jgi:prefoldin subunit 5